jgi:NADPH-dependent 2,4-dienoyl-CoA reductase/sulfur reductase-like enzyme/peroxiredoxin family protein/TusA-related sulfurtransferase/rhodanese-related sulfurtransferase
MKIVIIGGVAGGATAAARLRRIDEKSEIIMVERNDYISFANCGLPYHIGGVIQERERLLVSTPDLFRERFRIDVHTRTEALRIDRQKKQVVLKDLKANREFLESYDRLLLSPGGVPIRPDLPGATSEGFFTLRNMEDMDRIKEWITTQAVKKALVIGGGFIGLEMAENLVEKGITVSLVELADQVMVNMDKEMAALIQQTLTDHGVSLYLKTKTSYFEKKDKVIKAHLENGKIIETEMVLFSIGIRPEVKLAKEAGLELGTRGIRVNRFLQTSDESIYAVGDAVETQNPLLNEPSVVPLAGPANRQARIAADNMVYGNKVTYEGPIGTSIAKVFELAAGSTGLSEKQLKAKNIPYLKSYTVNNSHAGYYPDAFPITLKLLYEPSGKILGAQATGIDGVDKRIDLLAVAIKAGMNVRDLTTFELSYAPPFGSAKDPVNIAGYVASNILDGSLETFYPDDIENVDPQVVFLDVRDPEEQLLGMLPVKNIKSIPLAQLRSRLSELDRAKTYVTVCAIGQRGYIAYRILKENGFQNVKNLTGGMKVAEAFKEKEYGAAAVPANTSFVTEVLVESTQKIKLDACGLQCPGPIMETYKKMNTMKSGDLLEVLATDPGFRKDIAKWAEKTGNTLIQIDQKNGVTTAILKKGGKETDSPIPPLRDGKTIVVFSNDLDRALASFVIANGALAMGKPVTMFFTFWGLNILRKSEKVSVKKPFIEHLFGALMPRGTEKLKMSKMHMAGIGTRMIRSRMIEKKIDSLDTMMQNAIKGGAHLVACQMSMDLMGIRKEELRDGVEIGGVAAYLGEAEDANVNLFI